MKRNRRASALLLALCVAAGSIFAAPRAEAAERPAETVESELTDAGKDFERYIPTSVVQRRLAGGTDYLDKYGVTREKVVKELSAHLNDRFYLNTPFLGGDFQSPNGDKSYNGFAGTNCAGFVAAVLRRSGMDCNAVLKTMRKSPYFTRWGSGLRYDGLSSASNYLGFCEQGNLVAYAYPSRNAMLKAGKCEKGDIILRFWTDQFDGPYHDNHLMIFWGANAHENKVWQNSLGRVHIGPMYDGGEGYTFIVIKFAPKNAAPTPTPKPVPTPTPRPTVAGFADVYQDDWYAGDVQYVKSKDLMSGTAPDQFSPNRNITRGQLSAILWRMAGKPESTAPSGFSDVAPGEYYATAIDWAAENGLVYGYDSGRFAPNRRITRQEMAAILYRYWRLTGGEGEPSGNIDGFQDASQADPYAREALCWAIGVKLISGTGASTLEPAAPATRAQTAAILKRWDGLA